MSVELDLSQLIRVRRSTAPPTSIVRVGDLEIGAAFVVIAGPCAVEDAASLETVASAVVASGAHGLRGGAFKPRTSPYAFRGLGADGAQLLGDAGRRHHRPVVSEVMSAEQLPALLPHIDVLQIGARNMQNFELLRAVAEVDRPVLLKRGFGNTVQEWLAAAEHLLVAGAKDVVLCERGIRTFETSYRFTLDIMAVPVVKSLSLLPIIVDVSHPAGRADLVPALSRAAVAVGADGIMVEVHPRPREALCDGPQSLDLAGIRALVGELKTVASSVDKGLA